MVGVTRLNNQLMSLFADALYRRSTVTLPAEPSREESGVPATESTHLPLAAALLKNTPQERKILHRIEDEEIHWVNPQAQAANRARWTGTVH